MCVYMFTDEVILSIKNHLKETLHRLSETARGELRPLSTLMTSLVGTTCAA